MKEAAAFRDVPQVLEGGTGGGVWGLLSPHKH